MDKETFKMTFIIEDWEGITTFSKEMSGDSPHDYDFANFCRDAMSAYGFSSKTVDEMIPFQSEI